MHDIEALARAHTPEAIKALVSALKEPRERVAAAVALLNRGYGLPGQVVDLRHHVPAARAEDADLLAIIAAGSGPPTSSKDDQDGPGGMVH
jgi:HEAT repeat protein